MKFWIQNARFDLLWFIAPMAIPPVIVLLLPHSFLHPQQTEIFPWSWILIVLSIDVAHVYTTVYKTYFNPAGWKRHRFKMLVLPVIVWIGGMLAYALGPKVFWTLLAYFAVYHFIRQQYGFFRLYSRKTEIPKMRNRLLNVCIYAAPLIPILIWHLRGQQHFNWLQQGDFIYLNLPAMVPAFQTLFLIIFVLYGYLEWQEKLRTGSWNGPRVLLTYSTTLSYYVSVVMTDNDFIFSLVNVIGHGVPYLALVWISEKRLLTIQSTSFLQFIFSKWGWIVFYVVVFGLAYFEETIWDVFVWRENPTSFGWLYSTFDAVNDNHILNFLVPLLIMPQVVHYILDAYIWKKKNSSELT